MKKYLYLFLFLMSFNAHAQTATISVDENPVAYGQSFRLTLSIDKQTGEDPDFYPLKENFQILSIGNSFNTQIVNGFMKQSIEYNLTLMPQTEGSFVINPISIGNIKTNSLTIDVVPSSEIKSVEKQIAKLSGILEKTSAYVQEQLNYSLELIDDGGLELSEPRFSDTQDFIVKSLGDYDIESFMENGKKLRKITFHYALFPQSSGKLKIPAFEMHGYQVEKLNFRDPFGGTIFANMGFDFATQKKPIALRVNEEVVNIKPAPTSWQSGWWLPASDVSLTDKFLTSKYEVGQPIKRQIILTATGVLDTQLPELNFAKSEDLKQYPNKPVSTNDVIDGFVVSKKTFEHTYIPQIGGEVELPAISLDWFDVNNHQIKTVTLPAEKVYIMGGNVVAQAKEKIAKEVDKSTEKTVEPSLPSNQQSKDNNNHFYLLIASALGVGVVIGLFFARPKRISLKRQVLISKNSKELETNLLSWGQSKFDSVFNIKDVAKKVADKDFQNQIDNLYQSLYGKHSNFKLKDFLISFKKIADKKSNKTEENILPKLYN
ncbi:MAG: BatD family protein [Alphaproteobacteria bacterium]